MPNISRVLLELELYMIVMCMICVMGNKLKPSEKQQMLLTTEASLQPPNYFLCVIKLCKISTTTITQTALQKV